MKRNKRMRDKTAWMKMKDEGEEKVGKNKKNLIRKIGKGKTMENRYMKKKIKVG